MGSWRGCAVKLFNIQGVWRYHWRTSWRRREPSNRWLVIFFRARHSACRRSRPLRLSWLRLATVSNTGRAVGTDSSPRTVERVQVKGARSSTASTIKCAVVASR